MRTWFCLSLIKRTIEILHLHNYLPLLLWNHLKVPLLTKQQLLYTRLPFFFSFLNLARDSADALYNFAPAVHYYVLYITIMVTDPMN